MTTSKSVLAVLVLLALPSCGTDEPTPEVFTWGNETAEFSPPEIFTWSACAIELTPPPAVWKQQRLQESLEGVSFRAARVPPGLIDVGHYRLLHRSHTSHSVTSGRERHFEPPAPGFTLDDVVDRVWFDPETLPDPGGVVVQREVARSVDGLPGLGLDYTWRDAAHTLHGREVYVVADEHLFVVRVRGSEADLEVFERIVESIRFHPAPPSTE